MQENLERPSEVSDWQIVEDAGHCILRDRPESVVNAVRKVLEQVGAAPSWHIPRARSVRVMGGAGRSADCTVAVPGTAAGSGPLTVAIPYQCRIPFPEELSFQTTRT